jgi:hypothetical protein
VAGQRERRVAAAAILVVAGDEGDAEQLLQVGDAGDDWRRGGGAERLGDGVAVLARAQVR